MAASLQARFMRSGCTERETRGRKSEPPGRSVRVPRPCGQPAVDRPNGPVGAALRWMFDWTPEPLPGLEASAEGWHAAGNRPHRRREVEMARNLGSIGVNGPSGSASKRRNFSRTAVTDQPRSVTSPRPPTSLRRPCTTTTGTNRMSCSRYPQFMVDSTLRRCRC